MKTQTKFDQTTRKWMSCSQLYLNDPGFDEVVMQEILLNSGIRCRNAIPWLPVWLFVAISVVITALLGLLLFIFPVIQTGFIRFTGYLLTAAEAVGQLIRQYGFLIVALVFGETLEYLFHRLTRTFRAAE